MNENLASVYKHHTGVFEAANILYSPDDPRSLPVWQNFRKLEILCGAELEGQKWLEEFGDQFPGFFFDLFNNPHGPVTIDGVSLFSEKDNPRSPQQPINLASAFLKTAYWKEYTAAGIYDHFGTYWNKDEGVYLYTMSPYFDPRYVSDPVFCQKLEDWLAALIWILNPAFPEMYSVRVLTADDTLYYPGESITIIIGTKRDFFGNRTALTYADGKGTSYVIRNISGNTI